MASSLGLALLLLAAPLLVAAQSPTAAPMMAPAMTPAAPNDLVAILTKDGDFTILLRLLTKANLVGTILDQLRTSKEGLTIFAPNDDAFERLNRTLLLDSIPDDTLSLVLRLHVTPKFYNEQALKTVSNPVNTLAGAPTINITASNDQVNVSTASVTAEVEETLNQVAPLGLYEIDAVLLPGMSAPVPAPAPAPMSPSVPTVPRSTTPSGSAASIERKVGWGLLLGAALACMGLL